MQKSLKNITWQDFVKSRVLDIDTWPYLPSGTLKKPVEERKHKEFLDEIVKFHTEEWDDADKFVGLFSEKQKFALSWIFAAFISVLGNLAVNFLFATPVFEGNMIWMSLCLIIVFALTLMYLMYLPSPSLEFKFIHPYVGFPEGYEQHIPLGSCTNPQSQIKLQFGHLDELVIDFGVLVRSAILRDYLSSSLKNSSYIRISNIKEISYHLPAYFITISTNGVKPWLNPNGKEKIRTELRNLVQALLDARQNCGVRSFELEPKEWNIRGPHFIDGVSDWKFDDIRKEIINTLLQDR